MNGERGNAMRRVLVLASALAMALTAFAAPSASAVAGLPMTLVGSGFSSPVYVTNAGDGRLFVVEQTGRIRIIQADGSVTTFLDLTSVVLPGGEQGLLGLAFHPKYARNGKFYVTYTRAGDGADVVAEYSVSSDPNVADPNSGRVLLALADPYSNHNGGWIAFKGKFLYVSQGDGGSGGDPDNRAQDLNSLFGKILRIRPRDPDGAGPLTYTIPSTNPFVGRDGADEIWSYGLRNPWRCSFDALTGQLYCGDVGQGLYEEVDRVKTGRGVNFGWRLLEGRHYCNAPGHNQGDLCTSNCLKRPIAEYAHSDFGGGNCAVTGGYVSRRSGAALYGNYVFGDFCSGKVWVIPSTFAAGSTLPEPVAATGANISSFGVDSAGRIYLVDLNGSIYRLDES
jgi:glucose/arabinose dehydrogenase